MKIIHIFRKKKNDDVYFTIGDEVFVSPIDRSDPYHSPMTGIAHDLVRRQIKGESLLVIFEAPEGIEGINVTEGQKRDFNLYWMLNVDMSQKTVDPLYHFRYTMCQPYNGELGFFPQTTHQKSSAKNWWLFSFFFHLGELFS